MCFTVPADHRIKLKESDKKDKYLDLAKKWKNMEHEGDNLPIMIGAFGIVIKGLLKGRSTTRDHPNDSIIVNGQNTEKNPGDLRWLAVIQTSGKIQQLKLMWKTLKEWIIIIIDFYKRLTSDFSYEKSWTWLERENVRENFREKSILF